MTEPGQPTTPIPDFTASELIFTLKSPQLTSLHSDASSQLMTKIKAQAMAPLYRQLHTETLPGKIPWDESLYQALVARNEETEKSIRDDLKTAEEEEEELAIVKNWVALGEHYATIGDREKAQTTLKKAIDLTAGSGAKIDIYFTLIRLGLFFDDMLYVGQELDAVKLLIDKGGDWERRNRFKTYNGLYLMSIRNFAEASELLTDSLATFTSTEVASYEQVAEYAVVCGAISLNRVDLKKKVIDSPEVLSLLPITPALEPLTMMTNSLYICEYGSFFEALAKVQDEFLTHSKYLAPHVSFYVREMRRKAYAQLLESYKTLSLKSMANAFGVSVEYLDNDLSKFIPQNKLNCVIDKVNGIIVTNRPDNKNKQYQQLIKQGDALLTKLQKYGAAVRMSGAERI